MHTLSAGHDYRDRQWEEKFKTRDGDGDADSLYDATMRDPRTGRPPSQTDMAALEYAAEHSGVRQDGVS